MTIVNMEGTLTEETSRAEGEQFAFKGDADFADILVEGSVEAANLANNHTYDYGDIRIPLMPWIRWEFPLLVMTARC